MGRLTIIKCQTCCRHEWLNADQQHHTMGHLIILSADSASNVSVDLMTGLLQLLAALRGSAGSHDGAFLLFVGRQRVKHLLQARCDDGEAGPLVGLRVPALLHKVLHGIRHHLPEPAAQRHASSALPDAASHVGLPTPAPLHRLLHITRQLLPCMQCNVTES